jgi:23S rRNA (guanosine2251-2'-O)-methyltransferase
VKTEILYGVHPVYEALAANRRHVFEICINREKKSGRFAQLLSLADSRGISLKTIGPDDFRTLAGTARHQGVVARVSPYPLSSVADIMQTVQDRNRTPFLLMLDNILDPRNLGAIIRTALCAGIDGVIMPKDRSATPTPSVSRASAGALEHINLARVTNLVNTIKHLKSLGLWIIGLQKDAGESIYAGDHTGPIAVVVGGEQKGIRPLIEKQCDFLVSIPQQGPVDSLNASVAAGVAMYELFRQRQNPQGSE